MSYSLFQLVLLLFVAGFAQEVSARSAFMQGRIEVGDKVVTLQIDPDHSSVRIVNPERVRGVVGHRAVLHGVWTLGGIRVISVATIDRESKPYNSALTEIVAQGEDAAMVDYLLRLGADPNVKVDGVEPLIQALHVGHEFLGAGINLEIVTTLLDHGADPNVFTSKDWQTPLIAASEAGNEKLVRILLDHQANTRIGNREGFTALLGARNLSIMKQLIAAGAAVNDKDIIGRTALHYATARADPDAVEMLIKAGADVNVKDNSLVSALHLANLELQGEFPGHAFATELYRLRVRRIVDLLVSAGAVAVAE